MVDMRHLESVGVSDKSYKAVFTLPKEQMPTKVKALIDLICGRIRKGYEINFKEWRAYWAVDLAYEVPFNQTTPTLVHNLLSKNLEPPQILAALKEYGLSEDDLFLKVQAADGQVQLVLNPPVFFNIFIPIVKAYVTIRLAKLFNERNTEPLLEYKPLRETERNQVTCEIVTDLINTVSTAYGYSAVMRQMIQQMLKYGIALAFPREEWHCERQVNGLETVIAKEGLRYIIPDPTRMFYDLRYPITSFNSDSGCEYAGHWNVLTYGDIFDSEIYWNKERICSGTNWFASPIAKNYFEEVFPCSMKFPTPSFHINRRDDLAALYNTDNRDHSVFVTEFFMKLVPSQWGLGRYEGTGKDRRLVSSYDHPVWHRFTVAGDDTILWCAPCAYNPVWMMGYDVDENAARTPSMGLELIPWQDHLGNILSQMILTAGQNLTSVVFYDTNLVNSRDIEKMKNLGNQRFRSTQFIGFDSMKVRAQGLSQPNAFAVPNLPQHPVSELQSMIPVVLAILERVMQISAQEAGAQGSHQQSKYELQLMGGASTNRVGYTASFVDEGVDAWKKQVYDASVAYLDPEIMAQVSADIPDVMGILAQLGFKVEHQGQEILLVRGRKETLKLQSFARSSRSQEKTGDKEAAQVLFQTVQTIATNEALFAKVGTKTILRMVEIGAVLAGAPRGFKLREQPGGNADDKLDPKLLEVIQQVQQSILQTVSEKIGQPAAQQVAQVQTEVEQLQATVQKLEQIYQIASAANDQLRLKAAETQQKLQQEQEAFAAEEARKDRELQAKLEREAAATRVKLALQAAQTQAKVEATEALAEAAAKAKVEAAKNKPKPAEKSAS